MSAYDRVIVQYRLLLLMMMGISFAAHLAPRPSSSGLFDGLLENRVRRVAAISPKSVPD